MAPAPATVQACLGGAEIEIPRRQMLGLEVLKRDAVVGRSQRNHHVCAVLDDSQVGHVVHLGEVELNHVLLLEIGDLVVTGRNCAVAKETGASEDEAVVPAPAAEHVIAFAAVQDVVAFAAFEDIVPMREEAIFHADYLASKKGEKPIAQQRVIAIAAD